jgi:uncharacterized membrane protein
MHPYPSKCTAYDSRLRGESGGSLRLRHLNKFLVILIILLLTFNATFCFAANEEIGSAEAIIQRLANSKTDKTRSALIWGGIGLGYSILSLLMPIESHDLGWGSLSTELTKTMTGFAGAGFLAGAFAEYILPSGIENDYEIIKNIKMNTLEDKLKRNDEADKALKNRSNEAYYQRISRGAFLLSSSALYFYIGGYYSSVGVFFGGLGICDLLIKTETEKQADIYYDGNDVDSK